MLKAARHHVVTTDDAALALAALQESAQPLIVLLGEQLDPSQSQSQLSASDVLIHALESPRRKALDHQHAQHTYILLTRQLPDALPARVRAHLASGQVALLSPSCTIGDLLEAVEDAIERIDALFSSAIDRTSAATVFQQRRSELACRVNNLSVKQGQVIASLQRTKSTAVTQLASAGDAIYTTAQLLRDVKKRTYLSPKPSQSASLLPSTTQVDAIQRQGAS
ncbi:MAG TPA: hypothetical protein VGF38_04705 [Ktedonobacterales bacterium]